MAEPNSADDWLIVESYARWAGDTAFNRGEVSQGEAVRVPVRDDRGRRTTSLPKIVEQWADKRLERKRRRSNREQIYLDSISSPEPIDRQPREQKPKSPFIRGRNLRAVVSMVSAREFEMRGYPVKLDWVRIMLAKASDAQGTYAAAGRLDLDSSAPINEPDEPDLDTVTPAGAAWIMPGDVLRFVSVDSFGLIFVRGTWTAPQPFEQIGDVYNSFREVLQLLDRP